MANAASSISSGLRQIIENPTELVNFLAVQLPPQSTYYIQVSSEKCKDVAVVNVFVLTKCAQSCIQLSFISLTFGLGFECLRIFPLLQVFLRQTFGPSLTEKERNRIWLGLRPLSNPRNFFYARLLASMVLTSMILFLYVAIAPITCFVLAFSFLAMGSAFRNQFFYIYSTLPDSGGMLWVRFVDVILYCMATAQITLGAYLTLKKNNVAAILMIPLLVFQILFHINIRRNHFRVAARLPTDASLRLDAQGPTDFGFLKDKYKQSALMVKKLEPECDNEDQDVEGALDIQVKEEGSVSPGSFANTDEESPGTRSSKES